MDFNKRIVSQVSVQYTIEQVEEKMSNRAPLKILHNENKNALNKLTQRLDIIDNERKQMIKHKLNDVQISSVTLRESNCSDDTSINSRPSQETKLKRSYNYNSSVNNSQRFKIPSKEKSTAVQRLMKRLKEIENVRVNEFENRINYGNIQLPNISINESECSQETSSLINIPCQQSTPNDCSRNDFRRRNGKSLALSVINHATPILQIEHRPSPTVNFRSSLQNQCNSRKSDLEKEFDVRPSPFNVTKTPPTKRKSLLANKSQKNQSSSPLIVTTPKINHVSSPSRSLRSEKKNLTQNVPSFKNEKQRTNEKSRKSNDFTSIKNNSMFHTYTDYNLKRRSTMPGLLESVFDESPYLSPLMSAETFYDEPPSKKLRSIKNKTITTQTSLDMSSPKQKTFVNQSGRRQSAPSELYKTFTKSMMSPIEKARNSHSVTQHSDHYDAFETAPLTLSIFDNYDKRMSSSKDRNENVNIDKDENIDNENNVNQVNFDLLDPVGNNVIIEEINDDIIDKNNENFGLINENEEINELLDENFSDDEENVENLDESESDKDEDEDEQEDEQESELSSSESEDEKSDSSSESDETNDSVEHESDNEVEEEIETNPEYPSEGIDYDNADDENNVVKINEDINKKVDDVPPSPFNRTKTPPLKRRSQTLQKSVHSTNEDVEENGLEVNNENVETQINLSKRKSLNASKTNRSLTSLKEKSIKQSESDNVEQLSKQNCLEIEPINELNDVTNYSNFNQTKSRLNSTRISFESPSSSSIQSDKNMISTVITVAENEEPSSISCSKVFNDTKASNFNVTKMDNSKSFVEIDEQILEELNEQDLENLENIDKQISIDKKSKQIKKRKNLKNLINDDQESNELRRSKRRRLPPLETWRLERAAYELDMETACYKIVGIEKGSRLYIDNVTIDNKVIQPRKKRTIRKKTEDKQSDYPKESLSGDLSIHISNKKLTKTVANELIKKSLTKQNKLEWRDVGENMQMTIIKKEKTFSEGWVKMFAFAKKDRQITGAYETRYIILFGIVGVQIEDKELTIHQQGSQFTIAPNTEYHIENLRRDEAQLLFIVQKI